MDSVLLLGSVLVVLIIGGVFLRDLVTRKHDVLSWKYLFLAGYLVFFGTGGVFIVLYDVARDLHEPTENALMVLGLTSVGFLVVFLAAFGWGMRMRWPDRLIPRLEVPQTTPGVLICLGAMLFLVVASLAFPATGESFIAAIASFFRGGMSVSAVGLATYWLLTQRFNPLSWGVFFGTLGICLVASIAEGSGRRNLLGVVLIVPWVWYYMSLRYQRLAAWAPKAGALLFLGFVMLVGYSGVRASLRTSSRSVNDLSNALVQSATSANLSRDNLAKDLFFQDAAVNSMYLIDTHGSLYPMRPFQGAYWILVNPIPRVMWPNKPDALGLEISKQMGVQANLGPGVIGQGWSEAGLLGILYYAVFLGLMYGIGDRLIQQRADNPFFVVVMGSGIGQLIAMSRGDTPQFILMAITTMLASGGVILACQIPFRSFMAAFPRLRVGPAREDDAGDEAMGQYADDHDAWTDDEQAEHAGDADAAVEQDWGQASAAWEYSQHEAERG